MTEFQRNQDKFLRDLERKVERITGQVPLLDLMPPAFVKRHTDFNDLQEMVDAAPGSAEATSDEESADYIQGPEWDRFVAENSDFNGWDAMLKAAGDAYVKRNF